MTAIVVADAVQPLELLRGGAIIAPLHLHAQRVSLVKALGQSL